MKKLTFRKAEHLCLQRHIDRLFSAGSHTMTSHPLRLVYREAEEGGVPPVQVLVSVSKRRLHHAVDRNRTKRLIREAYRLHKHVLTDSLQDGEHFHLAFIWQAGRPGTYCEVETSMAGLLHRLAEKLASGRMRQTDSPENVDKCLG